MESSFTTPGIQSSYSTGKLPEKEKDAQPEKKTATRGRKRQSRSGENWTRSGCLTCKKRRKKCDETRPSCLNCARLGRTCEGYGTIWTEPLNPSTNVFQRTTSTKRRRLSSASSEDHGLVQTSSGDRDLILSPYTPGHVDDYAFPPTPASDVTGSDTGTENATPYPGIDFILPSLCGSPGHISSPEMYYLQYHTERGSKLLTNLEMEENPLRAIIIPRALSSPLVMDALCAVSAVHMSNWAPHRDAGAQTAAMQYYGRAINRLRKVLGDPYAISSCTATPEELIVTVAWLCKYEVVRGSVKQWRDHLDALQNLIASCGGFSGLDPELAEFISGLITYMHNMSKVTSRKYNPVMIPYGAHAGARKLDTYLGYTEDLVAICARISNLSFLNSDSRALVLEISAISNALETWTPTSRTYIMPKGITPSILSRLELVAFSFRYAAFIYLHSVLERIASRHPHALAVSDITNLTPIAKLDAIQRCLALIESAPMDDHCEYSAFAFPLFIAGCESEDAAQQAFVLRSLNQLEQNFGIGNVGRAKELLRRVWGWEIREDNHKGGTETVKRNWLDLLEDTGWELIMA
ncbi:C6 transcription factor [Paecilomyces variotii No. 5]|uniref:C6 transcription factor n=1 Tax=Byssochlamys spectabilis (strain No. 5 / NBRC 109023) TaxID=1356009 RepID=V5FQ09_BYSSN|nr:C6 transcription factor [Paecilomyces variotii No. 5]